MAFIRTVGSSNQQASATIDGIHVNVDAISRNPDKFSNRVGFTCVGFGKVDTGFDGRKFPDINPMFYLWTNSHG